MSLPSYVVLHLSHTDIRYDPRILKEMAALAEMDGIKIAAIGVDTGEDDVSGPEANQYKIDAIRLRSRKWTWIPLAFKYALNFLELTCKMFRKGIKITPSVIHCHDTLILPVGVLIGLFTGAKIVYDAHELESNKNGQSKLLSKVTLFFEKVSWARVNYFISVSDSINDWYIKRFGYKNNGVILNSPAINEISSNYTSGNVLYLRKKFSIPSDSKLFVYLGLLGSGRGIENCLQVFSEISSVDAHAVFIGYGPLHEKIESYAIKFPNIHLHPPVSHDEVVNIIRCADVGLCLVENVSLSDYYCLPNKLFEYSFAGLPVLASNFPEIDRVVSKYSLGRCTEPTVNGISYSVRSILKDGMPNKKSDLSEISWQAQAAKLQRIYSELLN